MRDTLRLIRIIMRRKILHTSGYRLFFIYTAYGVIFDLVIYFLTNRFVDQVKFQDMAYGMGYFSFVIIGSVYADFFIAAINSLIGTPMAERIQGNFETYLLAPYNFYTILFISGVVDFLFGLLRILIYVSLSLFLGFRLTLTVGLIGVLIYIFFSVVIFMGLGMMFCGLTLIDRRLRYVATIFISISMALSGAYYPLKVLPDFLRPIVEYFPLTIATTSLRRLIAEGQLSLGVNSVAGFIAALTIVLSVIVFSRLEKIARRKGTILFY